MKPINNYNLSFISNKDLYNHVKETVLEYSSKIDLKSFNHNVIDPIKLIFDSIVYGQTMEQIVENEAMRQLDRTNANTIGYFHQNMFKYFGNGWTVPQKGYDVVNLNKNIYCELKNKHNTMNSSSSAKTYMRMQNTLLTIPNSMCLLVEVIAPTSRDIIWTVTIDNEKQPNNPNIRRVSIDKFYDMVTGVKDSFAQICGVLPKVIFDVVSELGVKSKQNTVLEELGNLSTDIATSLFILAFERYEGFKDFRLNGK